MTRLDRTGNVASEDLGAWRRHLGEDFDPEALQARLVRGSLPQDFSDAAARAPGQPALSIEGEEITHAELDLLAAHAGGWLRAEGVEPGDRVILCGENSLDFVVAYLGILRARAIVVPAGAGVTEPEMRHLADDSGAGHALAKGEALEHLGKIAGGDSALEYVVALGGEPGVTSLRQKISGSVPLEPEDGGGDDTALLAYTSGTTGRPKGVPLSHANLLSSIRAAMLAWRWDASDVLVHTLPFSHQHGLGGVHATLLSGARAVVHAGFDPARLCATIESEGATVLFAVPAIYEKLLEWDGIEDADFSSLRLAVCGSSALSPALARKASSLLSQDVLERYGSTESGLSVSNPYDGGDRKPGAVGLPLPAMEMRVCDGEGEPVASGEDGEVVLRGPQVFSGYWALPDATRESFHPGGWFRTGDIGRVDPEDGYLSITGRMKEMIITGGLNVYPREVEIVLEEHPAVASAAVVGLPSERWGEEVVAFVVSGEGNEADGDELTDHARGQLSAYKCPKRVFAVDELPRDEMGKVSKDELIRMARDGRATGP